MCIFSIWILFSQEAVGDKTGCRCRRVGIESKKLRPITTRGRRIPPPPIPAIAATKQHIKTRRMTTPSCEDTGTKILWRHNSCGGVVVPLSIVESVEFVGSGAQYRSNQQGV